MAGHWRVWAGAIVVAVVAAVAVGYPPFEQPLRRKEDVVRLVRPEGIRRTQILRVRKNMDRTQLIADLQASGCTVSNLPMTDFVIAECDQSLRLNAQGMAIVEEMEEDEVVAIDPITAQAELVESASVGSWGLDRLNQLFLPLDGQKDNQCYPNDGGGVEVFVLDTGIFTDHSEFDSLVGKTSIPVPNSNLGIVDGVDRNGHGTHVAGTVAGANVGVARQVTLTGIKVLTDEGFGSFSDIIRGVEVVIERKLASPATPMVACMSLGGGFSSLMNQAITNAKEAGVIVVVAAGNNDDDACLFSPSSSPDAITVAAADLSDSFADFSNFGSCTTIIAPGVGIRSAVPGSTIAFESFSGTSQAAPHVAGAIALMLSHEPGLSTDDLITNQRLFGPVIVPPISKGVFALPNLFVDPLRGPAGGCAATTTTETPVVNPGSAATTGPAALLMALLAAALLCVF